VASNLEFTFTGDDDVYVFINGRLAIDLGGMHPPRRQTIRLNDWAGEQYLNLTDGGIYSFDQFHAERKFSGSNFRVTTSLVTACNVVSDVSTRETTFNTTASLGTFLLSRDASFQNGVLNLSTQSSSGYAVGFGYFIQQQNLAAGFLMQFKFSVSEAGTAEGFAVVFHQRPGGLVNLPSFTGSGLGYRGLTNSFAIVFDLCSNRNEGLCTEETVSINYPVSGDFNGPDEVIVHDQLVRSLAIGNEEHRISIEYLQNPKWLEVYIDDSLYLRVEDFNPQDVIGSQSSFVGFTTATTSSPVDLTIEDITFQAVRVDPSQTFVKDFNNSEPINILADGVQLAGIDVQTRDGCNNLFASGGRGGLIKGIFVERLQPTPNPEDFEDDNGAETRRTLRFLQDGGGDSTSLTYFNNSLVPQELPATIIDLNDGSYTVGLSSTLPGTFDLYVCVGADIETACTFNVTFVDAGNDTAAQAVIVEAVDHVVFESFESVARVIPLTPSPTKSPTIPAPTLGPKSSDAALIAGAAGGSALFFLVLISFIALYFRRRWNRDQAFIEEGKLYNMEREVQYDKNDEFAVVSRMVMGTQQEILRERAKNAGDGGDVITELEEEHERLQEQLRTEKQAAEESKQKAEALSVFSRMRGKRAKKKGKKEFMPNL